MHRIATPLHVFFIIAVALTLVAGNCPPSPSEPDGAEPTPSGTDGTPSEEPTDTSGALGIEFQNLSFEHIVQDPVLGPCPQIIGTILVTNDTDTDATVMFDVSDDGAGRQTVELGTTDVPNGANGTTTVPAGGSASITVFFVCVWEEGVELWESTVTVTVSNGTDTNTQTATVMGNVHPR